jgi:hypothetical protein
LDVRRDIDPTEIPIRLRGDFDIAQMISRLYSGVAADYVVSPDNQPPSIGSGQRHNIPCWSDFLMSNRAKWMA